jgi:hypothetical protein
MDGKYGGPFLKYVFQPIKDAADRYRKDRVEYRKKFQARVDSLAPIVGDSVIEAPIAGDYVCETDTTCVLAVPVEAQEALESATLVHVYEALGYAGDLQSAVAIRDMQMQAVRVLMEPRTEGAARAIFDPYSPLRRGRRRGVW